MTLPPPPARQSSNATQLTPRGAILVGILCMVCGTYPVLAGLGIAHGRPAPGVPPWVVVAAGGMFILAGLAVINGYAVAGGMQANGDLPDDASFSVRLTQYVLGLALVGLMFAIFTWTAFGPGERHFSSSFSMPGFATSAHSSERSGRIVFGIADVLIGFLFVVSSVIGAKRLWRSSQREPQSK